VSALLPIAYFVSTAATGWTSTSLWGQGIEQDTLAAVGLMASLFLLTVFSLHGNAAGTRLFVQALISGLTILFAFQALYVLFPAQFSLGVLTGQTTNLFGSWHDLGILAGLALFLSVMLWNSGIFTGWKKVIPVKLGILALFHLVIIHFTDVLYGAAILLALAALAMARADMQHGSSLTTILKKTWLPIVLAALLAVGGFGGAAMWDKLPERIRIVQTEVRPSWQGTFDIARQSLQAPSDLIFGTGPNSFIREWGLHKPAGVNTTPFWDSDFNYGVGIIPTSVFAAGAVGLIAWAALLLCLLGLAYRFLRESRPFTPSRAIFALSLASVAYLVIYHMIYTPGIALTISTFLSLGLLAIASAGDSSVRVIRLNPSDITGVVRLTAFVVVVIAAIVAAGLLARETLSNVYVNKGAYVYQTTTDATRAGEMVTTALMISPNNDRAHRAAAELGIVQLAKMVAETDPSDATASAVLQSTLQTTIQHGLTAVSINESNYQNWLLLAQVYGNLAGVNVEGAYEQAKTAYEKAFEANPTNPLPKLRLAQLSIARNDVVGARTYLNEAIALKPDFALAYFLLSQVEAADGQGDAAVTAASNAVQLAQQDPLGWFNLGYIFYAAASYQNAAQALAQAVTLSPDYSNALFFLGLSLDKLGDKANAVAALQRVLQLNPGETWIGSMITNIQAGKDPYDGLQDQAAGQNTDATSTSEN